jgi:ABC-type antimicrobial peptide transport system permease subunit
MTTDPAAPGKSTSEFKLTTVAIIVGGVLEAFAGVLHSLQEQGLSSNWFTVALLVCGALIQICGLFGYQKSRTLVKASMVAAEVPPAISPPK